jgi:hypothetical protein
LSQEKQIFLFEIIISPKFPLPRLEAATTLAPLSTPSLSTKLSDFLTEARCARCGVENKSLYKMQTQFRLYPSPKPARCKGTASDQQCAVCHRQTCTTCHTPPLSDDILQNVMPNTEFQQHSEFEYTYGGTNYRFDSFWKIFIVE